MRSAAVVAALLWTVVACQVPDTADPASASVVVEASGVTVVGTSESLAAVRDLSVMDDGSIWVLNSTSPFFLHFAPDGTVLAAYGTEGGGPEEFGSPVGFVDGGVEGEAWTFDSRRHLLVALAGPETPRREVAIPRIAVPPGSVVSGGDLLDPTIRVGRLGDEIVLPRSGAAFEPGRLVEFRLSVLGADLVALDPATGTTRVVVSLAEALDDPARDFEPVVGGFPLWFRLWSVCGDGIAVYDRGAHLVRRLGSDGAAATSLAPPPVPFVDATPLQFARAVFPLRMAEVTGGVDGTLAPADSVRLLNEMAGALGASPAELGAYLPRYVDLRCEDDGAVWLRPLDLDGGALEGARTWIALDPDGSRTEVTFPERFDPFVFSGDRVWGVQRDALDVASPAWVDLPGGGP